MPPASTRTVLITGAGQRIGRALALDFAAHGWSIGLHCHTSREATDGAVGRDPGQRRRSGRPARRSHQCRRRREADPGLQRGAGAALVPHQQRGPVRLRRDCNAGPGRVGCAARRQSQGAGAAGQGLRRPPARRRRGQHRQHHRPARVEADPTLLLLCHLQGRPLEHDADAGPGAGARASGSTPSVRDRRCATPIRPRPNSAPSARPPSCAAARRRKRSPPPCASSWRRRP